MTAPVRSGGGGEGVSAADAMEEAVLARDLNAVHSLRLDAIEIERRALAGRVDEIVELVAGWLEGRESANSLAARLRGLGSEAPTEPGLCSSGWTMAAHDEDECACPYEAGSGAPTPTEGPAGCNGCDPYGAVNEDCAVHGETPADIAREASAIRTRDLVELVRLFAAGDLGDMPFLYWVDGDWVVGDVESADLLAELAPPLHEVLVEVLSTCPTCVQYADVLDPTMPCNDQFHGGSVFPAKPWRPRDEHVVDGLIEEVE